MKTIDKEQYGYDREDIVKMRTALVEAREFIVMYGQIGASKVEYNHILDLIRAAL